MMELGQISLLLVLGMIVGAVFSSIGAAGGILASFFLVSIIGVTDPNSVKPMAQIITLAIALFFIPNYVKRSAYVLPLGLIISFGGVIGAFVGSTFSAHYLADMSTFRPLFGVLAVLVAVQIFWKLYQSKSTESFAFSKKGVHQLSLNYRHIAFYYGDRAYQFSLWLPWIAGFIIALIASIFGVGGGFLLVPFMTSLLQMPMFIVPATAAIAVFVSSSISIANYLRLGAELEYGTLLFLIMGGFIGAMLGPKFNRLVKESWLQLILAVIVLLIGIKYIAL
jgi:uncharacterized membrane protein YfcA